MNGRSLLQAVRWIGKIGMCLCGVVLVHLVALVRSSVPTSTVLWVEVFAVAIACAVAWGIAGELLKRSTTAGTSAEASLHHS